MVTTVELLQTIHDELTTVCADATSVSASNADEHVGLLNRVNPSDVVTPFFGFEWSVTPIRRGMDGSVHVDSINTTGGNIDSVTYRTERRCFLDIGILVDGDQIRTRDEYFDAVHGEFVPYIRDPSSFGADVTDVDSDGAEPSSLADFDAGLRQSYTIDYHTYSDESVPAAKTVNWGVDVVEDGSTTNAYPEEY